MLPRLRHRRSVLRRNAEQGDIDSQGAHEHVRKELLMARPSTIGDPPDLRQIDEAKRHRIVMPLRFSSGRRSAYDALSDARISVVFP